MIYFFVSAAGIAPNLLILSCRCFTGPSSRVMAAQLPNIKRIQSEILIGLQDQHASCKYAYFGLTAVKIMAMDPVTNLQTDRRGLVQMRKLS